MTPAITGVYEVVLAVRPDEVQETVSYYEQFGFGPPSDEGALSADGAEALYGHRSAVRAIRMPHQDSDHGLLRIMVWETAKNEGVGFGPLRAAGSRWATALTADPLTIYHHARTAQVMEGVVKEEFDGGAGQRKTWSESMYTVMPVPDTVYDPPPGTVKVPFVGSLPHVHELLVSRLVTGKQVLFSRADYSIPLYGKVNPRCHFPTSQFTHFGLIAAGEDHGVLDFYQDTLGLLKTQAYAAGPVKLGTRAMFDCAPEDELTIHTSTFDDPRSSKDFTKAMSGRLYCKVFTPNTGLTSVFDLTSPGSLGMCLYTLRVADIAGYHAKLEASAARRVSDVMKNELGERSVTFVAPDGYWWQLIEHV